MIDVHPPEHTPHTWRDFFIHIGTIVVGLCIAIGLEQSVEAIHHRHQAHMLEANMRAEAQHNIDVLNVHLEVNIPNLLWDRAALKAVRTSVPKAGFVDVTLPPPFPSTTNRPMIAPAHDVWLAATAAGTVVLLPDNLSQVYSALDHQWQDDDREVERIRNASALITRFELTTGETISPGKTLHLSLAQRDQLVLALSTESQQLFDLLHRDNLFLILCQAVLSGVSDPNSITSYVLSHRLLVNNYR